MVEARGGVYYSDPTDTMRGTQAYREGPPARARAQERKLDVAVPSWPDIDARIQAFVEMERQRFDELLETKLDEHDDIWREVIAQVIVKLILTPRSMNCHPQPTACCRGMTTIRISRRRRGETVRVSHRPQLDWPRALQQFRRKPKAFCL
jgi:hypothetical protein